MSYQDGARLAGPRHVKTYASSDDWSSVDSESTPKRPSGSYSVTVTNYARASRSQPLSTYRWDRRLIAVAAAPVGADSAPLTGCPIQATLKMRRVSDPRMPD